MLFDGHVGPGEDGGWSGFRRRTRSDPQSSVGTLALSDEGCVPRNPRPPGTAGRAPRCPPELPRAVRPGADAQGPGWRGRCATRPAEGAEVALEARTPRPVCCPAAGSRSTCGSHRDCLPLKTHTAQRRACCRWTTTCPASPRRVNGPPLQREGLGFSTPQTATCGAVQGPACNLAGRRTARLARSLTHSRSEPHRPDTGEDNVRMQHLSMEICRTDHTNHPALTRTRQDTA